VLSPDADNPALKDADDFGYRDSDAHGFKCPIGSHVRRSNPRDTLGPDGKKGIDEMATVKAPASILGTVTFASLGLIVASITNTMQETQIINQIIWFIFLFISGATIPFPKLPAMVQRIAVFLPATYLVSGLQRAMVDHANVTDLGAYLASLIGCAVIAFIVAAQLFRWEPEAKIPRNAKLWAAAAIIPFLLLGVWENLNGDLRSHAMKNLQSIREPYSLERIEH